MARYFSWDLFNKPFIVPAPTFEWSSKYSERLLTKVSEIFPPEGSGINKPNILILGASRSGKSSFINSIATVSENERVNLVNTAGGIDTVTTVYRKLEGKGGRLQNYVFADVRGISNAYSRIYVENIMNLIQGHIKEEYEFNCDVAVEETDECFVKLPKESDKFQCVVFVFDCNVNPSSTEALMKNIREICSFVNQKGIPRIALLTHVDHICSKVRWDIRNIFYSKNIKAKITQYAEVTGIPESLFYPIKNYEDVRYPDPMTSIPLLLALEACLKSAKANLRQKLPSSSTSDKTRWESDW